MIKFSMMILPPPVLLGTILLCIPNTSYPDGRRGETNSGLDVTSPTSVWLKAQLSDRILCRVEKSIRRDGWLRKWEEVGQLSDGVIAESSDVFRAIVTIDQEFCDLSFLSVFPKGSLIALCVCKYSDPIAAYGSLEGPPIDCLQHFLDVHFLEELDLSDCSNCIMSSSTIATLPEIKILSLPKMNGISDLSFLPTLQNLRSLNATRIVVDKKACDEISKLKHLEELFISNVEHRNCLPLICEIPSLRKIRLQISTNDGLKICLSNMTNLESLSLSGSSFNGIFPLDFSNLRNLSSIDLSNTDVDNTVLQQIGDLKDLQFLNLGATRVTDEGIGELMNLTNLSVLRLDSNDISGKAITSL